MRWKVWLAVRVRHLTKRVRMETADQARPGRDAQTNAERCHTATTSPRSQNVSNGRRQPRCAVSAAAAGLAGKKSGNKLAKFPKTGRHRLLRGAAGGWDSPNVGIILGIFGRKLYYGKIGTSALYVTKTSRLYLTQFSHQPPPPLLLPFKQLFFCMARVKYPSIPHHHCQRRQFPLLRPLFLAFAAVSVLMPSFHVFRPLSIPLS